MHELSLAEEILRIVEAAHVRDPFDRVEQMRLSVGSLAGVEIEALRFALLAMVPATVLDGARIEIDEESATGLCADCGQDFPVCSRTDHCPACGGLRVRMSGGTSLRVSELIVA